MRHFVNSPSNFIAYDYARVRMNVARRIYQPATKDIKKFTHRRTYENVFLELSGDAVAARLAFNTPVADVTLCLATLFVETLREMRATREAAFQRDPGETR
jgi:hypothetical protein